MNKSILIGLGLTLGLGLSACAPVGNGSSQVDSSSTEQNQELLYEGQAQSAKYEIQSQSTYTNPKTRVFVEWLYRHAFGEEGDQAGISFWTEHAANGNVTCRRLVGLFLNANGGAIVRNNLYTVGTPIQKLKYLGEILLPTVLGREITHAELKRYRTNLVEMGGSISKIEEYLKSSSEFINRCVDSGIKIN